MEEKGKEEEEKKQNKIILNSQSVIYDHLWMCIVQKRAQKNV